MKKSSIKSNAEKMPHDEGNQFQLFFPGAILMDAFIKVSKMVEASMRC